MASFFHITVISVLTIAKYDQFLNFVKLFLYICDVTVHANFLTNQVSPNLAIEPNDCYTYFDWISVLTQVPALCNFSPQGNG